MLSRRGQFGKCLADNLLAYIRTEEAVRHFTFSHTAFICKNAIATEDKDSEVSHKENPRKMFIFMLC